jgi:hypothetical protein
MLQLRTLLIQKGEMKLWLTVSISCALHSGTTYSHISGRTGCLLPQISDLALPNLNAESSVNPSYWVFATLREETELPTLDRILLHELIVSWSVNPSPFIEPKKSIRATTPTRAS